MTYIGGGFSGGAIFHDAGFDTGNIFDGLIMNWFRPRRTPRNNAGRTRSSDEVDSGMW